MDNTMPASAGGDSHATLPRRPALGALTLLACVLLSLVTSASTSWQFAFGFVAGRFIWACAFALPAFIATVALTNYGRTLKVRGLVSLFCYLASLVWLFIATLTAVAPDLIERASKSSQIQQRMEAQDLTQQATTDDKNLQEQPRALDRGRLGYALMKQAYRIPAGELAGITLGQPVNHNVGVINDSLSNEGWRKIVFDAPADMPEFEELVVYASAKTRTVSSVMIQASLSSHFDAAILAATTVSSLGLGLTDSSCKVRIPELGVQRLRMDCGGGQFEVTVSQIPGELASQKSKVVVGLSLIGRAAQQFKTLRLQEQH